MSTSISRAAVIGAGTMGAGIAVHLANAGLDVDLLDIHPTTLTPEEEARGLTLQDDAVRNRLAREGLARAGSRKHSGFYLPTNTDRVRVGNLEDHHDHIGNAEWVIEAVVEDLPTKQTLLAQIESHWRPGMIVTTNTSGLRIEDIAQKRSEAFKKHFLGTHFFNPPRVMYLVEVIPGPVTAPEIVGFMVTFLEERLGKGVVLCKDTPNFIANRVAAMQRSYDWEYLLSHEYRVEEGDAILSPLIGRPQTAHFRLADLVGLDVSAMVAANLYELIPDDPYREVLTAPRTRALRDKMIAGGMLGKKSGMGFYKAVQSEGRSVYRTLDLETLSYREPQGVDYPRLQQARAIGDLGERIRFLISQDDRLGDLVWASVSNALAYAATCIPEVSPDLISVDRVMRWGYAWELGPFELWDALGVEGTLDRMSARGISVPGWVHEMLEGGFTCFYTRQDDQLLQYDPRTKDYLLLKEDPRRIQPSVETAEPLSRFNGGRLVDLGDGVVYLDADFDIFPAGGEPKPAREALEICSGGNYLGLVISPRVRTNIANLVALAEEGNYKAIERMLLFWGDWSRRVRSFPKPIVTLCDGDCVDVRTEWALMAHRICAGAEAQFALDHVKWGLLPIMGGTGALLRRFTSVVHDAPTLDALPLLRKAFDLIHSARRSHNAEQARQMGFIGDADEIVMNPEFLLAKSKAMVLAMATAGYRPASPDNPVYVLGERGAAALEVALYMLEQAGRVGKLEKAIGVRLAHVLSGGGLTRPQWVPEAFILELENEANLSLLGEKAVLTRLRGFARM